MFSSGEELSPMNSVGNVFDVAMVFSVALLLALIMAANLTELLTDQDMTMIKNPGKPDMQIIQKTDEGIKIMEINEEEIIGGGIGEVLGTAIKLEDGTVIYVPDEKNTSGNSSLLPAVSNETAASGA